LDLSSQGLVNWSGIEVFVLDEADRMMDMGFLPDIRKVVKCLPQPRQTLLFSATIPPEIRELARSIQKEAVLLNVGLMTTPAAGVEQRLFPVPAQQKSSLLLHLLKRGQIDTLLVFTRTKHGADRLCRTLQREQFKAAAIHSGRTQSQRQQAMEGFRNGRHQILIATDIAARGIDIPNISHVINYDIPNSADDYIHRIGRTGRAEKQGMAYTFVAPEEESTIQGMEKTIARNLTRIKLEDFPYDASPQLERVPSRSAPAYRPSSGRAQGKKFSDRNPGIRRGVAGRHKSNPDSAAAHSPRRMKDSGQFSEQEDYARRLLDSLAADNPRGDGAFLKRGKFRSYPKSKPQFRW
jgi:ATP-dependent RNA helicase RhlE